MHPTATIQGFLIYETQVLHMFADFGLELALGSFKHGFSRASSSRFMGPNPTVVQSRPMLLTLLCVYKKWISVGRVSNKECFVAAVLARSTHRAGHQLTCPPTRPSGHVRTPLWQKRGRSQAAARPHCHHRCRAQLQMPEPC